MSFNNSQVDNQRKARVSLTKLLISSLLPPSIESFWINLHGIRSSGGLEGREPRKKVKSVYCFFLILHKKNLMSVCMFNLKYLEDYQCNPKFLKNLCLSQLVSWEEPYHQPTRKANRLNQCAHRCRIWQNFLADMITRTCTTNGHLHLKEETTKWIESIIDKNRTMVINNNLIPVLVDWN